MKRRTGGRGPLLAVACVVLAASGCATVTGGWRDQRVKVTSNPPGAAVFVDGQPHGITPAEVRLSRGTEHHVELAYPGYETARVCLRRTINPWLFGNILIGGIPGLVVDVCTDATHRLTPGSVHVNLRPAAEVIVVQPVGP